MKAFEDLPAWKAARDLTRRVYQVTRLATFRVDRSLCDQIQRAAVSVCANIAEGHERGSTPELIQFLYIAKGSCGEVRCLLYLAEDLAYLSGEESETLRTAAANISVQIYRWIRSMQTPRFKGGPKFHKEKDRSLERFFESQGMKRLPNGMYVPAGDRETERTEERKDGNPVYP